MCPGWGDGEGGDDGREQLAAEAKQCWETVLRGVFAIPNATALSLSAAALYTTGVAERAYRRIERLTGRIGGRASVQLKHVLHPSYELLVDNGHAPHFFPATA